MPPTGPKPFPPSKKLQKLDTEAKGRGRYEDGSLGPKPMKEQMNLIKNSAPGTFKVPLAGKGSIGTAIVSDKRTVKQKLADAQKRAINPQAKPAGGGGKGVARGGADPYDVHPPSKSTDAPSVDIKDQGGTLGGSPNKPIPTTDISKQGGGLKSIGNKTKTQYVGWKGPKKSLNAVVDKRSAKQKMKDAQTRRNS